MLKTYSVQQLNAISKNKEIWCFGCGKRLNDVLDLYEKESFIRKISLLLDNNRLLWGKKKMVGGKDCGISSPDAVDSRGNENILLLITSDSCQEIYGGIAQSLVKKRMDCSRYPAFYYTYAAFLLAFCGRFPIRRQMLFIAGSQPHENAKALTQYLIKKYQGRPYRLVFAVEQEEIEKFRIRGEKNIRLVCIERNALKRRNRFGRNLKYCFYTATSQYMFYENEPLEKVREGQILVYLNHGTIPLKKVSDVLRQPKQVDYALCPSRGCAHIYEEQYGIPKEKLLYGMPPRDDFLKRRTDKLNRIVDVKGIQVIMWLPTFRKLKGTDREDSAAGNGLSLIDGEKEWAKLNGRLKDNRQLLLIKKHPGEKQRLHMPEACDCIKLISEEDLKKADAVLQEMLGGTAALITDYSGISFEYLMLDRPIGYVVNDMNDYTRGFAFKDFWTYMPGVKIRTTEELMSFLDDVKAGRDEFRHDRKKLMERLFRGNQLKSGSSKLVKQLEELAGHKPENRKKG